MMDKQLEQSLYNTLRERFGHDHFRGPQLEIIEQVMAGKNTVVFMATGSGKSLCYQLPALLKEGVTIVVSPLIALMHDQIGDLERKGIPAACLYSALTKRDSEAIWQSILAGKTKLLYIAPETLNKESSIEMLKQAKCAFVAIDEAHCISDWGHDFRPEYRNLTKTIEALGKVPILALTATATPRVQRDIIRNLAIQEHVPIKTSFQRDNLYYEVCSKQQPDKKVVEWIKQRPGAAGIIYCHSRKQVELLTDFLRHNDVKVAAYHAGIRAEHRSEHQAAFLAGKLDVIVATVAFGMGIDKPDVRYVIHYDAPRSLEGYYQETGRAGRDGQPGQCLFLYDPRDIVRLGKLNRDKSVTERENANRLLAAVESYAVSGVCRQQFLLHYFGEHLGKACGQCDNCHYPPSTYEGREIALSIMREVAAKEEKLTASSLLKEQEALYAANKSAPFHLPLWSATLQQLTLLQLLEEDQESFCLHLTSKGRTFLQKPYSLKLRSDRLTKAPPALLERPKGVLDTELYQGLLQLRTREARQRGIKPYLLFHEKMLMAMATYYPSSTEALGLLPQIGTSKARRYGVPFISYIKAYLEEHQLEPDLEVVVKSNSEKYSSRVKLIQQIDRKTDLADLARSYGIPELALIRQLEELCYNGIKLSLRYYLDKLMDKAAQQELYDYFFEMDEDNIDLALEEMGSAYSEAEIRLMHIQFLSEMAY